MIKFLFALIGYVVVTGVGILVMIWGWGLEPVSWGWILGGTAVGVFIGAIFSCVE